MQASGRERRDTEYQTNHWSSQDTIGRLLEDMAEHAKQMTDYLIKNTEPDSI